MAEATPPLGSLTPPCQHRSIMHSVSPSQLAACGCGAATTAAVILAPPCLPPGLPPCASCCTPPTCGGRSDLVPLLHPPIQHLHQAHHAPARGGRGTSSSHAQRPAPGRAAEAAMWQAPCMHTFSCSSTTSPWPCHSTQPITPRKSRPLSSQEEAAAAVAAAAGSSSRQQQQAAAAGSSSRQQQQHRYSSW